MSRGLAERFHVSAAVGAFLVGLVLSGHVAEQGRALLEPLRDVFAGIFFVFFGLSIDPATEWRTIEALPYELTTSAARDVAAGRPSELDAITGSVVRAASRHGVPTPALAGLLADAVAVG